MDDVADLAGLGSFIRQRRRELGFTQAQLAERAGWSQERVSVLENGKYGLPSLPALAHLASALGCPLSAVIGAAGYRDFPSDGSEIERDPEIAQALLYTLERLLVIGSNDPQQALIEASNVIVEAMGADKVDVFLYRAGADTLVAEGTSTTIMGRLQHELGAHILPLATAGSTGAAFTTGRTVFTGRADENSAEPTSMTIGLGIRSIIASPLVFGGRPRGVFSAVSRETNKFSDEDVRFFESVTHWLSLILHHNELLQAEQAQRNSVATPISNPGS